MSSTAPEGLPEPHPVKAVMDRRHITVRSVAKYLGMNQFHVSKVLNNQRGATPAFRAGVCELLGLEEAEAFLPNTFRPRGRRLLTTRAPGGDAA